MKHLCVSTCEAIKTLALKGWSGRRIARELAGNWETFDRYMGPSKPAIPPLGARSGRGSLCEVQQIQFGVLFGCLRLGWVGEINSSGFPLIGGFHEDGGQERFLAIFSGLTFRIGCLRRPAAPSNRQFPLR